MKNTLILKEKNNISDQPNNFFNIVHHLIQKHHLSLDYLIMGIGFYNDSHDDVENDKWKFGNGRDFKTRLLDNYENSLYIELHFDYEEQALNYILEGDKEKLIEVEKYLKVACTKVNYHAGEIVKDYFGNEYTVSENSKIDADSNVLQMINVVNTKTKVGERLPYGYISQI